MRMTPRSRMFLAVAVLGTMLAGCQKSPPPPQPAPLPQQLQGTGQIAFKLEMSEPLHVSLTTRPAGSISHVVVFWLKKPGDAEGRSKLLKAREDLKQIPGVLDVAAGEVMKSERPVVDSTYDVGLVITFRDQQSMKAYADHAIHQRLLNEVVQPNVDHYKVYDFK